jgi:NADH dehydrogenase
MREEIPTVVIIGAGFGGLRAARALARTRTRVILLDRRNHHLFQPLLYQVATAGLEPDQIAKPVRAILRGQRNLEFRMLEAQSVDLNSRLVHTSRGAIAYDYLIVAPGGETDFFALERLSRHAFGLKDVNDAVAIRNHVLACFERAVLEEDPARRRELLTILVVGGGPTGVEMAGALAELIRLVLSRDYPPLDLSEVHVVLLEALTRILPGMPEPLSHEAVRQLTAKGVEVRLGVKVEDYDGRVARIARAEAIPAATMIWAAGARAARLAGLIGADLGRQGRVRVEATLQLPNHPEVYVIGDASYLEADGRPLPMMAPVAIQMAETAASNIRRQVDGRAPEPFRFRDPGSLATIGRNAAVAHIRGIGFRGFPAWVVWLVVHLVQLIGFRSRLIVLINWAWDYLFYDRGARLITRE